MISYLIDHDYLLFAVLLVVSGCIIAFFYRLLRQKSNKPGIVPALPRLVAVLVVATPLLILIVGYSITHNLVISETRRIATRASQTLAMTETAILGLTGKVDEGTRLLATSPGILEFYRSPTPAAQSNAHAVLDRYSMSFNAAVTYAMDTGGTVIASSNRDHPDSFMGQNYAFRPYFRTAMAGKPNGFFALGITSGKRGYYSGAPVINSSGTTTGVVVMKYSMNRLDSLFSSMPDVFLVDNSEMVFLSAQSQYLHHPLFPAPVEVPSSGKSINASSGAVTTSYSPDAGRADYNNDVYFVHRKNISIPGWQIITLSSRSPVTRHYFLGVCVTALIIVSLLIIISLMAFYKVGSWINDIFLSEKRFQTIFDHAPEAIIICESSTSTIKAANTPATTLFGNTLLNSRLPPLLVSIGAAREQSLPLTASDLNGIYTIVNAPGKTVSLSSATLQFEGLPCLVVFMLDISFLYEAQKIIAANEQKYRDLTNFLPEGVFEINREGFLTYVNKRALDLFGYTIHDIDGTLSPLDLIIPPDRPRVTANIAALYKNQQQSHQEYTALHKSGKEVPIMVHSTVMIKDGDVLGICGVIIDLSERRKIEAELQKKDKLEALGILAGGIAHDFNNLLTALWSGFSIIKLQSSNDPELVKIATEMENAIVRGRDLTGQLLTYAKGGAPVKAAASLLELVNDTAPFITRGTNVRCDITADPDLFTVDIDTTQISQVLQNLLINAREAMSKGGIITITLLNRPAYKSMAQPDIPQGSYVEIVIVDTGSGIPPELQSRIYDPFFTTKPEGSGLGLATAYSIVKNHNGYLFFESTMSKGTTFHILFPASSKKIKSRKTTKSIIDSASGRILLLDDELTILTVTKKLLTMTGYTVTTATTSSEAVACYQKALADNEPFDCVILDLTIPAGPGGKETLLLLRELDPHVKAIVSSGYSNDPIMAHYRQFGFCAVIRKPYDIHMLSAVVKRVVTGTH